MLLKITDHAMTRLAKRVSPNYKACQAFVEGCLNDGEYLEFNDDPIRGRRHIMAYCGYKFVFGADGALITVYSP